MQIKTLCCGESHIMMYMDLQEGKDLMPGKEFVTYCSGSLSAACVLRCTKSWHHSWCVCVGDSWFGSPTCVIALKMVGLDAVMCVKQLTRKGVPPAVELIKAQMADGTSSEGMAYVSIRFFFLRGGGGHLHLFVICLSSGRHHFVIRLCGSLLVSVVHFQH